MPVGGLGLKAESIACDSSSKKLRSNSGVSGGIDQFAIELCLDLGLAKLFMKIDSFASDSIEELIDT